LRIVRHGESEANVLRIFSNRGWVHGLTDAGRRQAQALAGDLAGEPVSALYASPLRRAAETAQILGDALEIGYELTDALREYDCGVLEGTTGHGASTVFRRVLDDWLLRGEWESRIDGGESYNDMQSRFVPFVENLVPSAQELAGDIVLVGHGGIFRCMLPLVLRNIDASFTVDHGLHYAAQIIAEVTPAGLVCTSWDGIAPPDLAVPPGSNR
jgi:probable phosphoglycerate mutase